MTSLDTLQPAIARIQGAIRQFANGDPEPYKACWSQAADVTISGEWPRRAGVVVILTSSLLALGTSGALAY